MDSDEWADRLMDEEEYDDYEDDVCEECDGWGEIPDELDYMGDGMQLCPECNGGGRRPY